MRRATWMATALLVVAGATTGVAAQEAELTDEEIIERIVELRRELDALLRALPAELRAEVERREGAAPEIESPETPAPEAPVVEAGEPDVEVEVAEVDAPEVAEMPEEAEEECAEFAPFDSNGDGVISAFDRYWRYFRLWRDDGDGVVKPSELSGLYDAGIREFSSRRRTYEAVDGLRGDVRSEKDGFVFDLAGKQSGSAALMIDADRLGRSGVMALVDGDGSPLTGVQRLGESSSLSLEGVAAPLTCP